MCVPPDLNEGIKLLFKNQNNSLDHTSQIEWWGWLFPFWNLLLGELILQPSGTECQPRYG